MLPVSHWHTTFSLTNLYASFFTIIAFPCSVSESSEGATFSEIDFSPLNFPQIELNFLFPLFLQDFHNKNQKRFSLLKKIT